MTAVRELPTFYRVADIITMTGLPRSSAYLHAARAMGREGRSRATLLVPQATWDRYIERLGRCGSTNEDPSGGAGTTTTPGRSAASPPSARTAKPPKSAPANSLAARAARDSSVIAIRVGGAA